MGTAALEIGLVDSPLRAVDLTHSARLANWYIGSVIAAGGIMAVALLPATCPRPTLFLLLLGISSAAAAFKISLPLSRGGSTMSVSYAADFTVLLLLGPGQTMLIAMVSGWSQCALNAKRKNPASRTAFSMASLAVTVQIAGAVFHLLGGEFGQAAGSRFAGPLVGAAAAYFLTNTWLVATAVALSEGRPIRRTWRDNFLWAGPSYFVGAGTAAVLATLVDHTGQWFALLAAAPVYLTFRTYQVYLGRIEDERRHVHRISELHWATMEALELARRSERALAAEKEQLAITLRSITDGVITTNPEGLIVTMNSMAERLTGWSQAEAAGRRLDEVFAPTSSERCDRLPSAPDVPQRWRAVLWRQDGSRRPIEQSVSPLYDKGRPIGSVLVFRDIADTLRLEEEQLKASKLESLGVLAGGIAHDFNNILLAIAGNISLARMNAGDAVVERRLADAERACLRARGLTQQLLTFSRGGAPVLQPLELADLLEDWSRFALHGSNVRCETALPPDLWPVEGDEGQLSQVINNIVINAQQAMPAGGTVRVTAANVHVGPGSRPAAFVRPDGPYVRIAIADEGAGIPEQYRRRIFDPYFTTKPKGTGLGLASCYSIVKRHGGHIGVESCGRGTTFIVHLPALTGCSAGLRRDEDETLFSGSGRLLVMDDEGDVRNVAADMLAALGYEVETTADGCEAIDRYHAARADGRPFDAVLMDLTVPGSMGGREVLRQLLDVDPKIRAIATSGYADDAGMAEYVDHGFRAVLPKPFTVRDLGRALQTVLAPPSA